MAREHARILCSIWQPGDDFRDRTPGAQRLYFLVLSQRELNNAGVIPLMTSKWARCSAATTVDDIEKDLQELEQHRYLVVDRDTDEVLVRTFVRNDGIAKQPNMLKSALRSARQIESAAIRAVLALELLKLGHRDASATAYEIAPGSLPGTPNEGIAEPNANPSPTPVENPSSTSEKNPSVRPAGWGGVGEGGRGSASRGGQVGGTREEPPAPNLDPDNPRCGQHAEIPADERGPNCRACAAVRRQVEAQPAVDPQAAVRAAWRAEVDACDECDENGKLELPDGSLARHHSPPSGRREAS